MPKPAAELRLRAARPSVCMAASLRAARGGKPVETLPVAGRLGCRLGRAPASLRPHVPAGNAAQPHKQPSANTYSTTESPSRRRVEVASTMAIAITRRSAPPGDVNIRRRGLNTNTCSEKHKKVRQPAACPLSALASPVPAAACPEGCRERPGKSPHQTLSVNHENHPRCATGDARRASLHQKP
jgi:hypothetical protein